MCNGWPACFLRGDKERGREIAVGLRDDLEGIGSKGEGEGEDGSECRFGVSIGTSKKCLSLEACLEPLEVLQREHRGCCVWKMMFDFTANRGDEREEEIFPQQKSG